MYLNLHLQVSLEGGEEHEEDVEGEFKHLRDTGDSILAKSNTQVLFDGRYEEVICSENRSRVLKDGKEEFQREYLGAEFMRPAQ